MASSGPGNGPGTGTGTGGSNNDKGKRKRQYMTTSHNNLKWQPKRGGPAVLITCDTGRDGKAKREGLQILEYYLEQQQQQQQQHQKGNGNETEKEEKKEEKQQLSLEEELAQLKKDSNDNKNNKERHNRNDRPFANYDTGCKGNVVLMCMLPNAALIPTIQPLKTENRQQQQQDQQEKPDDDDDRGQTNKKAKIEQNNENQCENQKEENLATSKADAVAGAVGDKIEPPARPWDPLATVRQVMKDIHEETKLDNTAPRRNKGIPGSRFVARMIPLQVTCFASLQEISLTFRAILDNLVLKVHSQQNQQQQQTQPAKTFGVKFKKRNCGHLTRQQVIAEIGKQVDEATNKSWTVNLDKPDYRIQIEICKTLVGISILEAKHQDAIMAQFNFNLADLRAMAAEARRGPSRSTAQTNNEG